jgi:hypothetical protein
MRARSLILLGLALQSELRGASAEVPYVRFEEGRLWVSCRETPVPDLFAEIARATGIRIAVDRELHPAPVTVRVEGLDLERALRNLVAAVPEAAGHTMSYERTTDGSTRLTSVAIFGPGKAPAGTGVYEPGAASIAAPDPEERLRRMLEAGVPRETAEKVIELAAEVQKLQATPEPGAYRPEDLSPESRQQLQPLLDRGVPMERAVQMLLLQEKYRRTLEELSTLQGRTPSTSSGEQERN